jgi:hypothetical protein
MGQVTISTVMLWNESLRRIEDLIIDEGALGLSLIASTIYVLGAWKDETCVVAVRFP